MIEINKIFMMTAFNEEDNKTIGVKFKGKAYWLGEAGLKLYPKSYFVDINKNNEKIIKEIIKDELGEIK